jgi:hypothetical protein
MSITTLLLLSILTSLTNQTFTTCEEYVTFFDDCECESGTSDKLLYGSKSFYVKCGGLSSVISVNPIDKSSMAQLLDVNDKDSNIFKYRINRHLTKDNEFITLKERCPYGSIKNQFENQKFRPNKETIGNIMYKVIFIAKHYLEKQFVLTNINPGQICLDWQGNPKIFDIRNIKTLNGNAEIVNSSYQYLPPEFFQSFQDDQFHSFDDKFITFGLGYLFYYLVKGEDPYILKESKSENIWNKEITFDPNDTQNFLNFIIKTITNHHNRLGIVELGTYFTDKEKNKFIYGTNMLYKERYYTLEENILHDIKESSKKSSIITVVFAFLVVLGLIFLMSFIFCREAFSFFMPQMNKNVDDISDNSGEFSIDIVDEKKEEPK